VLALSAGPAGAFAWKLDGEVQDSPLYCVDVFHSFYWGQ